MKEQLSDLAGERSGLMALAYRMLGTVADAEDAVQETYMRWYRMSEAERETIDNPAAWLTRVASRVCLDVLGSARVRREHYVGEWLPEPVPATSPMAAAVPPDPLDRVTLDDSVSTALLVVLEALTPAQRVVFVLHDVFGMPFDEVADAVGRTPAACRQLAVAARARVRAGREGRASRAAHDELVTAFAHACATGDLAALTAVLAPDVVLRSDGGGKVSAARRPVRGADDVARFLLGLIRMRPSATLSPVQTADGLGFVIHDAGAVEGVVTLGVGGDAVTDVWIMRNPDKLTAWE
ncbi:RNA polymerase sigma factor SigJ [Microbacter sp. GSS18]|nr:RNA polymerase sigma factor SigJ [Microbacter sp. GSS18]